MNDRFGRNGKEKDERFVRDVLARTSGSACARAEQQMASLMADDLEVLDRQLVQAHLEHCTGCRTLAVVMGWLGPMLPDMAELDPGPEFTARILGATSGRWRRGRVTVGPAGPAGLMDRLGRWWGEHILRPGFATQVAYVATVVLVLLTTVPGSPLQGVPGRALNVATAGPTALPVVGSSLDLGTAWLGHRADAARAAVAQRWTKVRGGFEHRARRTADDREDMATHFDEMLGLAGRGRLGEAGYELLGALRASRAAWHDWWNDDANDGGP